MKVRYIAVEKYTNNETIAFVHGYAYAKAEHLQQNDEMYANKSINSIISEIIGNVIQKMQEENSFPLEKRQVMPIIGGQSFHCKCGCNVFTQTQDGVYHCNACPLEYSGE